MNRAIASMISAALLMTVSVPEAWAEPGDAPVGDGPVSTENNSGTEGFAPESLTGEPVAAACSQFGAALNVAAANYEDFAYATAGNGNSVNYQDPHVLRTNVIGRTALREAAATALAAARTPGLPPEVVDPMTAWSLRATKLLVVMGLHRGGDSLNSNASELNSDAHDAQMACAVHGGHA